MIKRLNLYIDLCNRLILICSIQHHMKVNLWMKNSYRLWLTNWPKTSKP
ncbi:Zn-dependent oxidoreductase, partial [Escherichia coli]|nr:Zn-dependent oxidoreductase [Escherichia coli]